MSDHQTFLKSLPSSVTTALTERSDPAGLLHLAGHLGLIVVLGAWVASGMPLWWLVMLPLGIAICFLFTLQHEATHKTPFASEALNEWVGRAAGLVLILPFEWFRYYHLAHHRFTNIPGKDPELEVPKPKTWQQFFWVVSGVSYWRGVIRQLFINAMGRADGSYLPERVKPRVAFEARVMLGIYALALVSLTVSNALIWLWVLPALLGQPFVRIYLMAEHGGCAFVPDMFENTRTTFTNPVVRFLAWNMPYHAEHHVHPNVPFHKLPEFHALTKNHLKITQDGYANFARDVLAQMPTNR